MYKKNSINLAKVVKESNALVEAKYYLSEIEQRIILLYISQLPKNAPELAEVELPVQEVLAACGMDKHHHHRLVEAVESIMERVLTLRYNTSSFYKTHWIQSAKYDSHKSTLTICFDSRLKNELLNLREAYVTADAYMIISFKGKYVARLYLLIKQYISATERTLLIDDMIEQFELPPSYSLRISVIKDKLIQPSIEQINKKSDLTCDYEYIKQSRRIVAVRFYDIKLKSITSKANEINMLVKEGVAESEAKKIVSNYDTDRIKANIDYIKLQSNIKNKPGLLMKAIKDNYAESYEKSKQLKKDEEQRQREKLIERMEEAEAQKSIEQNIDKELAKRKIRELKKMLTD